MQIALDKSTIQRLKQLRQFGGSKQSHLEALNYLLVEADGHIRVQATNLTVVTELTLDGEVKRRGTALIPFDTLTPIQGESAKITSGEKQLRITFGSTRLQRNHQHTVDDFPFPSTHSDDVIPLGNVHGGMLKRALQHIQGIPDKNANQIWAETIWVLVEAGTLTLGAADGFQLAIRKLELDNMARDFVSMTSPDIARLATFLDDQLADEEESISLSASASHLLLKATGVQAWVALKEGKIPNYQALTPNKDRSAKITLKVGNLRQAIRAIKGFSPISHLTMSGSRLTLTTQNSEYGSASAGLEVSIEQKNKAAPTELVFGLDLNRLQQVLAGVPDNAQIAIYVTAPDRPVLFEITAGRGSEWGIVEGYNVLMPMLLQ